VHVCHEAVQHEGGRAASVERRVGIRGAQPSAAGAVLREDQPQPLDDPEDERHALQHVPRQARGAFGDVAVVGGGGQIAEQAQPCGHREVEEAGSRQERPETGRRQAETVGGVAEGGGDPVGGG
jgi:hypothetical protein